mgnify:CR=1 FL=1
MIVTNLKMGGIFNVPYLGKASDGCMKQKNQKKN